jgi:hypothetical protein
VAWIRRERAADGAASPSPLPRVGAVVAFEFDGLNRTWRTRVEWAAGANLVIVAPTRPMGDPLDLPDPERQVSIGWPTEAGYFEALGRVTGHGTDTVALWTVAVQTVRKRQRRSAYRLPAVLPVVVSVAHRPIPGETKDVSEGGLRCLLPPRTDLFPGEHVQLSLTLPETGEVSASAKVVRRLEDPAGIDIGLSFVEDDDVRSDALRQYVFSEQLRRRRAEQDR